MTTKKQRAELETALGEWVFDGIANEWSTTEILVQVAKDWRKVVGAGKATSTTGADLKGLSEWQGTVLDLLGVGTGREAADKQRQADAGLILWSTADMPEHSVVRALVQELAEEILSGVSTRRGVDVDAVEPAITFGYSGRDGNVSVVAVQ